MGSNNRYNYNDREKRLQKELEEQENMLPYTEGNTKEQCETKIENIKWELNDIKTKDK